MTATKNLRVLNFLIAVSIVIGFATQSVAGGITYEYDDQGQLKSIIYDDGARIDYTYDKAGNRLTRTSSGSISAPSADLSVAITDGPDPLMVGSNVTYNVTVTNGGPANATAVNLSAALPGTVTFVSATPSQGTCNSVVSCALGPLASAGSATVAIVVTANVPGLITYAVSVSAPEGDPAAGNDSATATTTVEGSLTADLAVTVSDTPDPVTVGDSVTYSVTVSNGGPDEASDVRLSAVLPADVTLVSATPSQGACDTVVNCALGSLAPAGTATVSIVVAANAVGALSYTLSVSALEDDPVAENDSATATTTVNAAVSADLAVVVVDSKDPAKVGERLSYNITVTNGGPDVATGVSLSAVLPANVTLVSANAGPGRTCDTVVNCDLGNLANGALARVEITVRAQVTGTITYPISVSANENDPIISNNSATETTTINLK